jgi:hypothetical protein
VTSGFGIKVVWDWDKNEIPKGHSMPFMQATVTALEGVVLRAAFPTWLSTLTKRGREAHCGYIEMKVGHLITLH